MATDPSNTSCAAAEGVRVNAPTPVSKAFSGLLVSLSAFIEAERDIEDVDIWDPAFSGWLREAELAQERVVTGLGKVRDADLQRAEDRPLQRLTLLIDAMIGSEEPGEFTRLHRLVPKHADLFRCRGESRVARRVNHMLRSGLACIDELATLDTFADRWGADLEIVPESPPEIRGDEAVAFA